MIVTAAALGAVAVALGAFGAHALRDVLSERALGWFATGVEYHARHALALLGCGLVAAIGGTGRALNAAAWAFVIGTLVFSGSLYLMAFTGATWLGAVTPLGGVSLIAGWVALAVAASGTVPRR